MSALLSRGSGRFCLAENPFTISQTFPCHNLRLMIHMGIRCSECGRVHLLSALRRLRRLSRLTETPTKGVYQISCISPCGGITYFRIEDTRPFAVPDDLYRRGYGEPGECEPSQIA